MYFTLSATVHVIEHSTRYIVAEFNVSLQSVILAKLNHYGFHHTFTLSKHEQPLYEHTSLISVANAL